MWMTSNSRAEGRPSVFWLACVAGVVVAAHAQLGVAAQAAPDAPRQAPAAIEQQPLIKEQSMHASTVELQSVSVRRPDETHKKMAGPVFHKQALDPLVVEVKTQQALPQEPRTSSPVIVLNGEKLVDTWVILPDTLVAFLPNRSKLKDVNSVAVVWLGNEEATRTKRALTFRRADLPR